MGRPEILTSALLAVAGLVLALWLASNRPPPTPSAPDAPGEVAMRPALVVPARRLLPSMVEMPTLPDLALGPNGLPCGATLDAGPSDSALMRIAVDAPCMVEEVIEIAHGPLRFAQRLSRRGTLRVDVPLVDPDAGIVAILGGDRLEAKAPADMARAEVSGLVWSRPLDLALSAFEFGAAKGAPGHVTAGSATGTGRVLRLGDPALGPVTSIYFGSDTAGPGVVRLHVEARRTDTICGSTQPLVVFRSGTEGLSVRDVRLALRECDPGPVVLRNLLEDQRVARR